MLSVQQPVRANKGLPLQQDPVSTVVVAQASYFGQSEELPFPASHVRPTNVSANATTPSSIRAVGKAISLPIVLEDSEETDQVTARQSTTEAEDAHEQKIEVRLQTQAPETQSTTETEDVREQQVEVRYEANISDSPAEFFWGDAGKPASGLRALGAPEISDDAAIVGSSSQQAKEEISDDAAIVGSSNQQASEADMLSSPSDFIWGDAGKPANGLRALTDLERDAANVDASKQKADEANDGWINLEDLGPVATQANMLKDPSELFWGDDDQPANGLRELTDPEVGGTSTTETSMSETSMSETSMSETSRSQTSSASTTETSSHIETTETTTETSTETSTESSTTEGIEETTEEDEGTETSTEADTTQPAEGGTTDEADGTTEDEVEGTELVSTSSSSSSSSTTTEEDEGEEDVTEVETTEAADTTGTNIEDDATTDEEEGITEAETTNEAETTFEAETTIEEVTGAGTTTEEEEEVTEAETTGEAETSIEEGGTEAETTVEEGGTEAETTVEERPVTTSTESTTGTEDEGEEEITEISTTEAEEEVTEPATTGIDATEVDTTEAEEEITEPATTGGDTTEVDTTETATTEVDTTDDDATTTGDDDAATTDDDDGDATTTDDGDAGVDTTEDDVTEADTTGEDDVTAADTTGVDSTEADTTSVTEGTLPAAEEVTATNTSTSTHTSTSTATSTVTSTVTSTISSTISSTSSTSVNPTTAAAVFNPEEDIEFALGSEAKFKTSGQLDSTCRSVDVTPVCARLGALLVEREYVKGLSNAYDIICTGFTADDNTEADARRLSMDGYDEDGVDVEARLLTEQVSGRFNLEINAQSALDAAIFSSSLGNLNLTAMQEDLLEEGFEVTIHAVVNVITVRDEQPWTTRGGMDITITDNTYDDNQVGNMVISMLETALSNLTTADGEQFYVNASDIIVFRSGVRNVSSENPSYDVMSVLFFVNTFAADHDLSVLGTLSQNEYVNVLQGILDNSSAPIQINEYEVIFDVFGWIMVTSGADNLEDQIKLTNSDEYNVESMRASMRDSARTAYDLELAEVGISVMNIYPYVASDGGITNTSNRIQVAYLYTPETFEAYCEIATDQASAVGQLRLQNSLSYDTKVGETIKPIIEDGTFYQDDTLSCAGSVAEEYDPPDVQATAYAILFILGLIVFLLFIIFLFYIKYAMAGWWKNNPALKKHDDAAAEDNEAPMPESSMQEHRETHGIGLVRASKIQIDLPPAEPGQSENPQPASDNMVLVFPDPTDDEEPEIERGAANSLVEAEDDEEKSQLDQLDYMDDEPSVNGDRLVV